MRPAFLILLPLLRQLSALLSPEACTPFKYSPTQERLCCDEDANTLFRTSNLLGLGTCCKLASILTGLSCFTAPPPPSNLTVCPGEPVCAVLSGIDMALGYGHCYVLKSVNGLYLGHDYAAKYEVNRENPDVVFLVYGDTDKGCNTHEVHLVGVNDTWWSQDQMGDPNGTGFGWLGGSGDLKVQDNSTKHWLWLDLKCALVASVRLAFPSPLVVLMRRAF
ncbi:hypothetical protein J3458_007080 [Metarhizium acridum]|uniref:uncharacterized protein n=1 Tax=Metarhizium acridum TaxID=92637 RepID=UPI001C6C1E91|nr:hypothetical protein J3458_007080 [Metarhizium acridum]